MAEIQELSIKITADGVGQTAKDIRSLKTSLKSLSKTLTDVSKNLNSMNFSGLNNVVKLCDKLSNVDATNVKSLASALKDISRINISRLGNQINQLSEVLYGSKNGVGTLGQTNALERGFTLVGSPYDSRGDLSKSYDATLKGIIDNMKVLALQAPKQFSLQEMMGITPEGLKLQELYLKNQELLNQKVISITNDLNAPFENATASIGNTFAPTLSKAGDLADTFAGKMLRIKIAAAVAGKQIAESFGKKIISKLTTSNKKVSEMFAAFKRIAMYRILRSVIKAITDAFKEGISNAYQWSKAVGDSFSKNMDKAASAVLTLKNSIAASLMPVINALTPYLLRAADALVTFFNALSRTASILTGASYWTKAKTSVKEYAQAVDSAKKSLAGFDELNNIGGASSSGTGTDYKDMFENIDLEGTESKFKAILDVFDALDSHIVGIVAGLGALALGLSPIQALGVGIVATGLVDFFKDLKSLVANIEVGDWTGAFGNIIDLLGDLGETLTGVGVMTRNVWVITVGLALYVISDLLQPLKDLLAELEKSTSLEESAESVGKYIGKKIWQGFKNYLNLILGPLVGPLVSNWLEKNQPGENLVEGTMNGAESKAEEKKTWWQKFWEGLLSVLPSLAKIHSPSKLYEDYGNNLIQGLCNGVNNGKPSILTKMTTLFNDIVSRTKTGMSNIKTNLSTKWNEIKSWWQNLELPSFKIKMPHITWSSTPASGWIARTLEALGIPTSLPKMQVSWYDVGTNYVSQDQLAMIHKGEAIVPAKYNTDPAYQPYQNSKIEELLVTIIDTINDKDMNTYIDGNEIGKASVKYINKQSRLKGASIV